MKACFACRRFCPVYYLDMATARVYCQDCFSKVGLRFPLGPLHA